MNFKFIGIIIAIVLLFSAISGCTEEKKEKTMPSENRSFGNLSIENQIIAENTAETHNSNGISLMLQNRFSEAEREFREAIRLNPDFAEAHANLGSLYAMESDTDNATQELEIAYNLFAAQGKIEEAKEVREIIVTLKSTQRSKTNTFKINSTVNSTSK